MDYDDYFDYSEKIKYDDYLDDFEDDEYDRVTETELNRLWYE